MVFAILGLIYTCGHHCWSTEKWCTFGWVVGRGIWQAALRQAIFHHLTPILTLESLKLQLSALHTVAEWLWKAPFIWMCCGWQWYCLPNANHGNIFATLWTCTPSPIFSIATLLLFSVNHAKLVETEIWSPVPDKIIFSGQCVNGLILLSGFLPSLWSC